jgi:hypothetical protein
MTEKEKPSFIDPHPGCPECSDVMLKLGYYITQKDIDKLREQVLKYDFQKGLNSPLARFLRHIRSR